MMRWVKVRLKKPFLWRLFHPSAVLWARRVEKQVQEELGKMPPFPDVLVWDHLPKPTWRTTSTIGDA